MVEGRAQLGLRDAARAALAQLAFAETQHVVVAAERERRGHYFVLCFSERELRDGGPRRVTQAELRDTFGAPPFRVLSIDAAEMATNLDGEGPQAWLARVERVANP